MIEVIESIDPSLSNGYATGPDESAYPESWDGLVGAWFPALGYQGGGLFDFSRKKQPGALTNMEPGTDWSTLDKLIALDYGGTDEFVNIPMDRALSKFTLITSFNASTDGALFARGVSSQPGFFTIKLAFGTRIQFVKDGSTDLNSRSSPVFSLNNTFNCAVTWDGSGIADDVGFYKNGNEVTHDLATNGVSINSDSGLPATIGGVSNGARITAKIPYTLLYDRVLSADRVLFLNDVQLAPFILREQAPFFVPAVAGAIPHSVFQGPFAGPFVGAF